MKTLPEQLTCAKRELALRRSAYPKWVASQRMNVDTSKHEIECMESIVATLEKMVLLAEVSEEMKAKFRKENPQMALSEPKTCVCCGAPIDKGQHCENCTDTPANVAQADLI